MTLEQKVAQLFMVRPEAVTQVTTQTKAGDYTKECLEKYPVGGIVYFSKNKTAAIVLGTKAPIVLTSRADSAETKFLSIATAVALAAHEKK